MENHPLLPTVSTAVCGKLLPTQCAQLCAAVVSRFYSMLSLVASAHKKKNKNSTAAAKWSKRAHSSKMHSTWYKYNVLGTCCRHPPLLHTSHNERLITTLQQKEHTLQILSNSGYISASLHKHAMATERRRPATVTLEGILAR